MAIVIVIIINILAGIYLINVNNKTTKRRCKSIQSQQKNVIISSRFHPLLLVFLLLTFLTKKKAFVNFNSFGRDQETLIRH